MKENKEKTKKVRINKGQLAVRIMAGILVMLMIIPMCATCVIYLMSAFGA